MATIAAAANTPIVTNDRIRSSRRITCETSSWAGRSTASQQSARYVTLTRTKTAAYSATGAAANLVSAIHTVANGMSDTEKGWAKLNHTSRGVATSAYPNQ